LLHFQKTVADQMTPAKPAIPQLIAHRRMTPIAGQ
jgi:hypothetical protein